MRPEEVFPKILLFLGSLTLLLSFTFRNQLKHARDFNLEKIKTYRENFFASSNLQVLTRQRPISTALIESRLEVSFGQPFRSFNQEDWNGLWEIVYGLYPKGEPKEAGLPNTMRQLTEEEIISELRRRYPEPFVRFNKDYWTAFFYIIQER